MNFNYIIKVVAYCIGSYFFAINILNAQEIPSRENDGVTNSKKRTVVKDVYADLNLSREQQKKLQELAKDNRQKMKELSADSMLTGKQKRDNLLQLRNNLNEKRKTILTPEQNEKYEQNIKEIKNNSEIAGSNPIINNTKKNNEKDPNGLSRNSKKTTSKKKNADWNSLNLSDEQKGQIKQWNEEYHIRLQTIRYDGSLKGDQKNEQIEQLVREQNLTLGSILTVEQKTIWDEKQRQLKMRMSDREIRNNPRLYYSK